MSRTGYFESPLFTRHDTGPAHPERADRLLAITHHLESTGLRSELDIIEAHPIDPDALLQIHDATYIRHVEQAVARGARILDEGDTHVSSDSWRAALAAAGGAVQAVDRVLDRELDNAFVAARPPGHHAERAESMGFCLFNNAALAASHLRTQRGLSRVAIVDWDVHHGNGTQHIFERDPSVFYASLHQWPLYPGTGLASERGLGEGEGATLNCPQPPGSGDTQWLAAFEDEVLPALDRFAPEFVIVSAGFDAHRDDPLAQTCLSTQAFRRMTTLLAAFARERCAGRIVSLLEGGYDLDALAHSVAAHLEELKNA